MMTSNVTSVPVRALALSWDALARQQTSAAGRTGLKMFLDGDASFDGWVRFELEDFVTFVQDPADADVLVRVTPVARRGKLRQYQVDVVGSGRFELIEASTRLHVPGVRTARFLRPVTRRAS